MKKGFFKIALGLLAVGSLAGVSAQNSHEACEGFVPKNDMKIPEGYKHPFRVKGVPVAGGIDKTQFDMVIERFEKIYGPEVKKAGGTLKVNRKWTDATVNADASQQGKTWLINMYGGLARHPTINVEGFALVICHEGGHHLGGAPKIDSYFGQSWASNEGAADYFASLKCLRKFFAEDDNETIVANAKIDPMAKELCEKEFSTRADQLFCMRSSMAGESVAYLFMDLRKEKTKPELKTPDKAVVTTMDDAHPGTQCRMDTYFAGASCHVDVSVPVSNTDYKEGSCIQPQDTYGWRPLCWFKP